MKLRGLTLLLGVVLAMGSLQAALAQATNAGDISGIVTDTTGAAIPGATVTVINIDTGVTKDYTTNAAGVYDTSSIVAGNYKLTFSKEGFTQLVRSSITVPVGPTTVNAAAGGGYRKHAGGCQYRCSPTEHRERIISRSPSTQRP